MNTSIHRYTLRSKSVLNAKSERLEHHGALIRVGGGRFGYGCIHPWPELGDLGLDEILVKFAQGEITPLAMQAVRCAADDARGRMEGCSLFDGLSVPRSHATLSMNAADFQDAIVAGFSIAKVKVGRDMKSEVDFIRSQVALYPRLRWRLDFNGTRSQAEVDFFLQGLGEAMWDRIDFIEDATSKHPVPVAVDRVSAADYDVTVIKPALQEPVPLLQDAVVKNRRVVITSYMDHPLGQTYAAWEAAKALSDFSGVTDVCGLVTHGIFEPNDFSACLGSPSPEFHPPAGTGLGFDELLESLPWIPLR